MKEDEQRCMLVGMDGFISKPLDLASLAAALEHWSAASRAENASRQVAAMPHSA
jgi:CheY-like chemotaxis protein